MDVQAEPLGQRVFKSPELGGEAMGGIDRMGGSIQPLFGSRVWDGGEKWKSVNYAKMRTPLLSPKLVRM